MSRYTPGFSVWTAVAVAIVLGGCGGDDGKVGGVLTSTINPPVAPPAAGFLQSAYLKAPDPGPFDMFGAALAIDGDTLAVGESHDVAGTVYVFERVDADVWMRSVALVASNPGDDDEFGAALAIAGDTMVVGATQRRPVRRRSLRVHAR